MNELLQSEETLTDEEILLCAEALRLWEEDSRNNEKEEN